jgi:hypothetical protein
VEATVELLPRIDPTVCCVEEEIGPVPENYLGVGKIE